MSDFDPLVHVMNAAAILDPDGTWPNFHDATVDAVRFDRGDVRPDDDIWLFPTPDVSLTLCALGGPAEVRLQFHGCDAIDLSYQGCIYPPDVLDLTFAFEDRGTFTDGTPLPPWIAVRFEPSAGFALSLRCFRVEALGRCPPTRP